MASTDPFPPPGPAAVGDAVDCSQVDLALNQDALTVIKRPVAVQVEFAATNGVADTLEGPVHYHQGDALVTGEHGDFWPIARENFDRNYVALAGQPGRYAKRALAVLALRMHVPFFVEVGTSRSRIWGQAGDWLLQYTPFDHGVLSAAIFDATYRVAALAPGGAARS